MNCPFVVKCPFFIGSMQNMPSVAEMLRTKYCREDYEECARFKARQRLGPGNVPMDLFPGDHGKLASLCQS